MGLCASDRSDIYVVDSPRSRRFRKQLFMHHWGLADERWPQRVHFQDTYGPYDLRLLTIHSLEGVEVGGELAGELRHNAGASTRPRPPHGWAKQCVAPPPSRGNIFQETQSSCASPNVRPRTTCQLCLRSHRGAVPAMRIKHIRSLSAAGSRTVHSPV